MNMRNLPSVSVIIITYNHEKYIGQALESVLNQKTDFPFEVWVGDDASTDATPRIVHTYQEQWQDKLHVIFRKENTGASANLYDLLQHAAAPYIAFLEGDDYWLDGKKLQKQYDFLTSHPEYTGCTHECRFVDGDGQALEAKPLEWISRDREFGLKNSRGFYLAGQMGTLFCRNLFKGSGDRYSVIRKAHPMISDRTVQMVLALEGTMFRLPETMSAYRRLRGTDGNNATAECFDKNMHSAYDNFRLTCRLEQYAREFTGSDRIDFSYTKKLFFTSAVYQWVTTGTPELYNDIRKILRTEKGRAWRYFLFLPRGIAHKLIQRLR